MGGVTVPVLPAAAVPRQPAAAAAAGRRSPAAAAAPKQQPTVPPAFREHPERGASTCWKRTRLRRRQARLGIPARLGADLAGPPGGLAVRGDGRRHRGGGDRRNSGPPAPSSSSSATPPSWRRSKQNPSATATPAQCMSSKKPTPTPTTSRRPSRPSQPTPLRRPASLRRRPAPPRRRVLGRRVLGPFPASPALTGTLTKRAERHKLHTFRDTPYR